MNDYPSHAPGDYDQGVQWLQNDHLSWRGPTCPAIKADVPSFQPDLCLSETENPDNHTEANKFLLKVMGQPDWTNDVSKAELSRMFLADTYNDVLDSLDVGDETHTIRDVAISDQVLTDLYDQASILGMEIQDYIHVVLAKASIENRERLNPKGK